MLLTKGPKKEHQWAMFMWMGSAARPTEVKRWRPRRSSPGMD